MNCLFRFLTAALLLQCLYVMDSKAQFFGRDMPLAHTYSIVAYDSATGDMGVAVQSHWFSVGTVVSWAEAGVGAIATQSLANPAFGPDGLALLRSGLTAGEALDSLLAADEGRDVRQLAIVDSRGNVAAWTGRHCIAEAGHLTGRHFSVQANLMRNDSVWPAMKRAYESASGSLEERLLAALEAAEASGGDIRGSQSAALLVVRAASTGKPWADRSTDIRIDDHPDPIGELRRIYRVKQAYDFMNLGDVALEEGDMEQAINHYNRALGLMPESEEIPFWTAVTAAQNGMMEEARRLMQPLIVANPDWKEVLRRIYGTPLFDVSEAVYRDLTGE